MPFQVDKEIWKIMEPLRNARATAPKISAGNYASVRKNFEDVLSKINSRGVAKDIEIKDYYTKTSDGYNMLLRWYNPTPGSTKPGPAVMYLHGGGMICCNVPLYDHLVSHLAADSKVPFLAVDFRSAPEHAPGGIVQDNYCALKWMRDNASVLNIEPARIAVMGDSGGGGLGAALGIYARDQKFSPPIAKMILIYPMLDDRNTTPDPEIERWGPTWDWTSNANAWTAVLGKDIGGSDVSPYAAPARVKDPSGLPPTFIDVAELDIFRDEEIEFARRLGMAGVSCELHVYPGVVHCFDYWSPGSKLEQASRANRIRALQSF